ncbi:unnamed protein product [Arabis nemorensis]|uniref:Wall-associated receptor kinase galacturonan-binding domain-containing protein n=1 Tax=Arabis nemorensis TaxID=586526 RepID=A0A565CD01_9BRAS|nr:unnamed protein product [Arabis nemorensis]
MSSNKTFSLLILFSLLLLLIFDSAALTALKSCPSDCGAIEILYPFGIGKGCYLEKWYEINCTSVSGKLVPFLSVVSKEVVKISLPGEFSWGSAPLSYGSVRIKKPDNFPRMLKSLDHS